MRILKFVGKIYYMKYIVKKLDKNDWEKYRDIRLEALKEEPDAFGSSYSEYKDKSVLYWMDKMSLLSEKNGKSFLCAVLDDNNFVSIGGAYQDENNEWNIIAIYTKKESRGLGAGSLLFNKILEELKNREVKKVFLRVNIEREPAISMYKKFGFKIMKSISGQILGDGKVHDEHEMYLDL